MSLPKAYNRALHNKANFYAAWFPVTTPYSIGDYGLIQNGVFQKIGHLDDLRDDGFNVEVRSAQGNPVTLDFLSEGARSIKTVAGASVADFPSVADLEAKLTYEFERKNSFVVKAAEMNVERMENIQEVVTRLARLRSEKRWSHRNRVVSATYTGKQCLVLLSSEAGTKVEFVASASALKQLDLGNVEIKPSVSFSSDTILRSIGESGVLGLGLFKLKFLGSDVDLLKEGKPSFDVESDWGDELEDDLR